MRVTVVGCSGSYPTAGNPGSCYLIEHDGTRVLLDLGSGAFGALAGHRDVLDDDALHAVILSHLHADHMVDMAAMHVARTHRPAGPMPPLTVWGPMGTAQRIADVAGTSLVNVERRFTISPLVDGQIIQIGSFEIRIRRMRHSIDAFAVRIEAGGSVCVYSGDTAMNDALIEIARDADIALIEATWPEPGLGQPAWPEGVHLSGREAGQVARRAQVNHLVLTHHAPWADQSLIAEQARESFGGLVTCAAPGMILNL